VERVLSPPHHPYTEVLLSSVPVPDPDATARPLRLEGGVPGGAVAANGCPFHARCPRRVGAICEEEPPPAQVGDDGHVIVCHIPLATLAVDMTTPPVSRQQQGSEKDG
jgi:peptide/nickel transport system ATP-binding protein